MARDTGTPPPVGVENPWHNTRKMVYVKTNPKTNIPSGFWPIPESFWTDLNASSLVSWLVVCVGVGWEGGYN